MTREAQLAGDMPPVDISPKALKSWLAARGYEEIECILPDMAGVSRGKAMPASKFAELAPSYLPESIFFQSITGKYVEFESDDVWTEADLVLSPDFRTLRPIPWAPGHTSAQVIHDLHHRDGSPVEIAPRNVLKRILARYAEKGWHPVVAPEIEFYLTKQNTDPDYPLEPPVGRSGRQSVGRQAYSMMSIDEYEPIIEDIYAFANGQNLAIDTIVQEDGAAQMEINLRHGNALDLADQVFLFKRLIREAAFKHGCYATFMAKPMDTEPGSAMHIHCSVVDDTGQNIFSDAQGEASECFYHYLGGLQHYLSAATCLMVPYVNSYRRMVPGVSAPINLEWGTDNRSVGLRVPASGPASRRVENRVVGVDANPYLALAATLACGFMGLEEQLQPRPALQGYVCEEDYGLPLSLLDALSAFKACTPLKQLLGERFCELYYTIKSHEYKEYAGVVTPWEREHLLLTV